VLQAADGSQRQQERLLAEALASLVVLGRPTAADAARVVRVSAPDGLEDVDLSALRFSETVVAVGGMSEDAAAAAVASMLMTHLPTLQGPRGVLSFVASVMRTRSVDRVRDDMDDREASLTAQFGHCTQELLNLLLTGRAVSNAFDGTVPLGDSGLLLRGLERRARVGYLSQLEALRYCQVGSFYKAPEAPVWVVGSASHFSVGFALDAAVGRESPSEALFQRVQRVFKSFDPMETGFMPLAALSQSLAQLGVASDVLSSDYWMARLLARLEMADGAGILLWDEYWKVVSVLLHTGDLELALSGQYASGQDAERRPRSDSDLARELQAQFDAEQGGGAPVAAASSGLETAGTALPSDQTRGSNVAESTRPLEFDWYYYNGLRICGGTSSPSSSDLRGRQPVLVKCRVKLPSTGEFIGKSVAIAEAGTSGGHGSPPLEEILKTKWPDAQLIWDGGIVPSVD